MGSQQQINIAIWKMTGLLNAGSFKSINFKETVKDFVPSDKKFSFINAIKETPAYWKRF